MIHRLECDSKIIITVEGKVELTAEQIYAIAMKVETELNILQPIQVDSTQVFLRFHIRELGKPRTYRELGEKDGQE